MAAPEKSDFKSKNLLYDLQNNSWSIEDESEYMDVIRYNFPEDAGCTPFSKNHYFHHFIDASGFTYLGEYEEFKKPYENKKVQNAIPMGYKSILIYERVCLIDKGKLIFEREVHLNSLNIDEYIGKYVVFINKPQKYEIPSWGNRELVTYEIRSNIENKLHVEVVDDLNIAKETAIEYSERNQAKCIVCMILEYVSWH